MRDIRPMLAPADRRESQLAVHSSPAFREAVVHPTPHRAGTTVSCRDARPQFHPHPRLAALILAALLILPARAFAVNAIVLENQQTGNPASEWDISGAGDASIQGFATDISVDQGETIDFKISTDATAYRIDIYRLGWYAGLGARKVATVLPSATLPQAQPAGISDPATGLLDCGNWAVSASWPVPAAATSGVYIAKLVRTDPEDGRASHIAFVVRDDDGGSALLFQTMETTWQAYNTFGGNSLYAGSATTPPAGRAHKVSFNRPFATRGGPLEDWVFNAEYPMIRWLEANGYDVSYFTGIDADRRGAEILEHAAYLSVGHDEYWSAAQRAAVEAARDAGVHLAFFSGNEVYWKIRWENSVDGSGTPHRTMVCYKEGTLGENNCGGKCDPLPGVWTGLWRDGCPPVYAPNDACLPENALTGQISWMGTTDAIRVPGGFAPLRLWRNTSIASLLPNQTATLSPSTLGYEWNFEQYPAFYPAGRVHLSETVSSGQTHRLSLYRHASGALVFGAGTVQWSWGLDGTHDRGSSTPDPRMQQMTVNLLAEMGAQPETPQPGIVPVAATGDVAPPASAIGFPLNGGAVQQNVATTISGTAADAAGVVAAVEVSVDGGATWERASGGATWTYSWTPAATGSVTLRTRAADDLANLETPGAGITVTVDPAPPPACPCTVFLPSETPANPDANDGQPIEVGMKFRALVDGEVTGVRFYKGASNTGTHVGTLWTSGGSPLASVTFTGETASGWQEASFASPVAVTAGATYVISLFSQGGGYAFTGSFFAGALDRAPLRALANGEDGPNGVYNFGAAGFPTSTYQSSNYWVDVVFDTDAGPDLTPPTVTAISPGNGASGVNVGASVTATFSEPMDPLTLDGATVELRDPATNLVAAAVSYHAPSRTVTLDPAAALAHSTTYTAIVRGGATDPRAKDVAGNALAADQSWSFTTAAMPPPPPDEGPGGPILVIAHAANPFSRYYAEILRCEGLNAFTVTDISLVDATVLGAHDVAILGEGPLSPPQVAMLTAWVNDGGNLIAMRPDPQLAGLLGLGAGAGTLSEGYLLVNTGAAPGAGITAQTMQFHGAADRWTLAGASAIATLYADPVTATAYPAATLYGVGSNGGTAASFAFDLARSVVYTRQGNPAWSGQERDGTAPIRSNDLFYGAAAGDPQPDWVNLDKVAIPQADEQQRLLANLILHVNADRKPLPRFWYLPKGLKGAVVMTGDDHGSAGGQPRFDTYLTQSPGGCSLADWECVRATDYLYTGPPFTDAQALAYHNQGFEVALHVNTGCANWTQSSLENFFDTQLAAFAAAYPSVPPPVTQRTHCIAWSDWATQPRVEAARGIRLDTNYYYWPASWVLDRPGVFTGSAMPMRFADLDGSLIDCYQVATQMTDESGQNLAVHAATLFDRAIGSEGYYGVFCANMHFDFASHAGSDAIVAAAQARGIAVVSARQMLEWLDGRNGSSFGALAWSAGQLSFTLAVGAGAHNLRAMLPVSTPAGELVTLTRDASPVAWTVETIKGVAYAFFPAAAGAWVATYAEDADPPVISNIVATPDGSGTGATLTWDTDEPADSRVDYGTSAGSLTSTVSGAAPVTSHSLPLTGLVPGTLYHFRVTSADAAANSATEPNPPAIPLTFATPTPPCASDDTFAEFGAGSIVDAYVSREADGEVILAPAAGDEFEAGLPAGWAGAPWGGGGGVSFVSGAAQVDGALFGPTAAYGVGSSVECNATFTATPFQHIGLSDDFSSTWAIFSTGNTGAALLARVNPGADFTIPGSWLGTPHRFRIDWTPGAIVFSIDGAVVHTQPYGLTGALRALASDFAVGGPSLAMDWMRVLPYAPSGSFTSRVFDGGASMSWGAMTWSAQVPAGTGLVMLARTGSTPVPDGGWTAFVPVASSGSSTGLVGRYFQYRADLTTSDPEATPALERVAVACEPFVDNAPPVITNVAASPAPAGTSATITWDTDEPADSRVDYGLSPGALNSSSSASPFVIAHSRGLTGLLPGTTYYYRVTSEDPSGNSATEPNPPATPLSFTTPVGPAAECAADDLDTDFALGSTTGAHVARTVDGEVMLAPAAAAEFAALPPTSEWQGFPWSAGGTSIVAGGSLVVDGSRFNSQPGAGFGPGSALEFVATFAAEPFQHVGFGGGGDVGPGEMFNTSPWAMFSTGVSGAALQARCWNGGSFLDVTLPGSYLGAAHHYRIQWNAGSVAFLIDGALVHTEVVAIAGPMRAGASDFNVGGATLAVDWMRVTPYAPSGTFTSRVFDAGLLVAWGIATWTADVPGGASLAISVRTGNTPTPDGTWSAFAALASSGTNVSQAARYLQYRAQFASFDPHASARLDDIQFTCDLATAALVSAFRAEPDARGVRLSVELGRSETGAFATFSRGSSSSAVSRTRVATDVPVIGTRAEVFDVGASAERDNWYWVSIRTADGETVTSGPVLGLAGSAPLASFARPPRPNPVSNEAVFEYRVGADQSAAGRARVSITVHDLLGRKVRTVVETSRPAGSYREVWDGRDDAGVPLRGGVYYYSVRIGELKRQGRVVVVR